MQASGVGQSVFGAVACHIRLRCYDPRLLRRGKESGSRHGVVVVQDVAELTARSYVMIFNFD